MSTTTDNPDSTSEKWRATSKKYSEQWTQFKLTSLYADDLITLLHDDIQNASTILDIGCGTGIFAHAYLRAFPNGIPGQTIISSDISPSMIEQAQSTIGSKLATIQNQDDDEFATKFLFQLEDGSQLSGIADHSIDIVVSVYGVFLIPDQVNTLRSIQRVLKPQTGIFANAAWTKHDSIDSSFGGNLQEVFMGVGGMVQQMMTMANSDSSSSPSPATAVTGVPAALPAFLQWFEPTTIATNLKEQKYVNIQTYRMFHSMIGRNFNAMFEMCIHNPMIDAKNLSEEQLQTLKHTFFDLCQIPHGSIEEKESIIQNYDTNVPFTLWTASNLTIAYVVGIV
jgi:ubiquinone/menaquinone biosynthesis C-methylase UbiE